MTHLMFQDPAPADTQTRPYGTRRSTQTARPGVAAGLARRTRVEIEAEATQKKDKQIAKKAREREDQEVKTAAAHRASKKIAATMDEKARQEAESVARLDKTPPPEESSEDEFVHPGEWDIIDVLVVVENEQMFRNGSAHP